MCVTLGAAALGSYPMCSWMASWLGVGRPDEVRSYSDRELFELDKQGTDI
jgi:hypothetical protein